ncbi:MAG: guanylate kinase [Betaproteobacteria bacterium]|nr:guanylate kinase [Betaproteobacteria bacterium]NBT09484.1 guanylate kinase [Betaproteobacteria bacterium]NBU49544.1 guanylate kinase [Betaproteobacteria bacterium]
MRTDTHPHPGCLFVVAAPSGAGKSSQVKALLGADPQLAVSVSHTTRAPRGQEAHGREYWFIDDAAFDRMVQADEFFEWAQVHGHRYGTSRRAVLQELERGQDVVLEIDWQGALNIKRLFPDAVLIFILPPSWEELQRRLVGRGEDAPAVIDQRLANARLEVSKAQEFDFVIINGCFEVAQTELQTVVRAQRLRYSAQRRRQPQVFSALGL